MKTIMILLFLPLLTSAYNLDTEHALVYSAPVTQEDPDETHNSYFGYNVLLYWSESTNKTWLIVGAPKANYTRRPKHGNEIPVEPGAAFRFSLNGTCEVINIRTPEDDMGFIKQIERPALIEKERGWLGAAMSLDESSGELTVCAPRNNVKIYDSPTASYHNSIHGVCYKGNVESNDFDIEDKNFTNFDFSSPFWANPMNGFAVHYHTPKVVRKDSVIHRIFGAPNHELYGTVHEIEQKKFVELPIGDRHARFGYALTSGYYFHGDQLMIVGGAPGWRYVGQVVLMNPQMDPMSIVATVEGKEVGEYFGASLATGDINRDRLDDLIVGAPHWKNDNGRVYIFLGNEAGFSEADLVLEGSVDDGLFGYAVTCGDLDGDNRAEIIVSAPWEESGVVYVYNGDSKITSDKERGIRSIVPSQRIAARTIRPDLLRFGFSLAKPLDMDRNGFSDIAVGAYGSGHAVILLSRPVQDVFIIIHTNMVSLPRNVTKLSFTWFPTTWEISRYIMHGLENCTITTTVDEDYNRVADSTRVQQIGPHSQFSTNNTFYFKKDIRNFIDPIDITMTHRFSNCNLKNLSVDTYGKVSNLCPIAQKGVPLKQFQVRMPFDVGCGTDDTCNAVIWAKLEFPNTRNSTWIIGSGDLRLMLTIGNYAETAYRTRVLFDTPEGMSLKSILPSCDEKSFTDGLHISCDVGNLAKATEKRIGLDFDMSRMHNASKDGVDLNFRLLRITTDSVNRGVDSSSALLHLKADVSIALSGKADGDRYHFNPNFKPTNVSLRHIYQVSSFGATRISDARLTIRVPRKLGDVEYLKMHHKPRLFLLGRYHECEMNDLPLLKPKIIFKETFSDNKMINEFDLETTVNHSWSRWSGLETGPANTDAISHSVLGNFNESGSHKNIASKFYKTSDTENADIMYLNCWTPDVTCGQIVCNIPQLKTIQDVATVELHLVIDYDKFTDDSNDREKVVHFGTDARVDVPNPSKNYVVSGFGVVVPVTTKFHRTPHPNNAISIWIIIGSVLLGLLAQGPLTMFLRKIDFFKRPDKARLDILKNSEAISLEDDAVLI